MVVRAEHEPDALVPQQGQMPPRLLDRDGVVARDAGETEVLDRRVHEDDGHLALREQPVVLVPGVRLGELAAREDHAGHLLLEQQFHVVRLGDAAVGLGAQDGGEALLGERTADHVRERGKDRVLQLRQDEPDQARALAAQLGRPLVAQDVQGREHGLPGGLRDAGLVVEHPADRRLTDADLLCHLSKSPCHGTQD